MNLSLKIAKNTIVQIVSKISSTILGLFAVAIMARYLGQNGFGAYTTIVTFASFFAILADLGLTLVTVQMISDPQADEEKILGNLLTVRLLSALVLLSAAPIVGWFFPYGGDIKLGILLSSLSFIFIALNQIIVGLFQKRLTMGKTAIAENLSRIILLAGIYLVVHFHGSLLDIIWVTVVSSAVNFLIHWLFARKLVSFHFCYDRVVIKQIMRRSWPLAVTIAFNLIYLKTDTLILSLVKTEGEVGLYGAAYKVIDVLVTLPFMFLGIILPLLTSSWLKKELESFKNIAQKSFDFLILLALPISIGAQFLATDIVRVIAGEEFAAAGEILKILILAASLIFISCLFSHIIIAVNKQTKIIGAYIFTGLTSVALYFWLIPRYSYIGAAWGTVYSELCITLFALYYTKKYTNWHIKLKLAGKALVASLLMALFLALWPNHFFNSLLLSTLVTIILAAAVYLLGLYLTKALTKADWQLLRLKTPLAPSSSPLDNDWK